MHEGLGSGALIVHLCSALFVLEDNSRLARFQVIAVLSMSVWCALYFIRLSWVIYLGMLPILMVLFIS